MNPIYFSIAAFTALVALGLVFYELHLRAQRTRVVQLPGGLRFEAQKFSVQFQRSAKEVQVQCARGVLQPAGAAAGATQPKPAPVACTFAALGFRAEVRDSVSQADAQAAPVRTGLSEIAMRGADGAALTIPFLNATVAADFAAFFRQVRLWIDKLEQRQHRERVAHLRAEDAAAQAQQHAELMARVLGPAPVAGAAETAAVPAAAATPADTEAIVAAQIAHWRRAAGFEGQHSLWQADARGVVSWFVDVAADGRITVHADQRTLHGTLRGASITPGAGDLHLGLRDAHWTEQEPELQIFRVLRGLRSDERRAWKERLEIVRNTLQP